MTPNTPQRLTSKTNGNKDYYYLMEISGISKANVENLLNMPYVSIDFLFYSFRLVYGTLINMLGFSNWFVSSGN